jgi:hypothetical protein
MIGSYRREESSNALSGRERNTVRWQRLAAGLEGENGPISSVVAGERTKM